MIAVIWLGMNVTPSQHLIKTELRKTDILAHLGGDEFSVLILRKTDILARLGSDEFGLLLYQCPLEPAQQLPICCGANLSIPLCVGRQNVFYQCQYRLSGARMQTLKA